MTPTRPRVLIGLAAATTLFSWLVLRMLEDRLITLPALPWSVPTSLVLLAGTALSFALDLRRRLRGGPGVRPVDPLMAARLVAWARAAMYAGAVLVGAYGGLVASLLPDWSDGTRSRVLVALFSTLAAVGLVVAGWFLERVCRVEPPDDEQPLPSA